MSRTSLTDAIQGMKAIGKTSLNWHRLATLTLVCAGLSSTSAFAVPVAPGGGGIAPVPPGGSIPTPAVFQPTDAQIAQFAAALPKLTEPKILYHWIDSGGPTPTSTTPPTSNGLRWVLQGKLSQSEVDVYDTPSGTLQCFGPGVYFSDNPVDSQSFGWFLVKNTVAAGTPYFDPVSQPGLETQVFGRPLSNIERTVIGKRIPFIRKLNTTWWLTNSAQNLQNLTFGEKAGLMAPPFSFFDTQFNQLVKANPSDDYVKSLLALLFYQDGISAMRSTHVAPSNPWSQFEPEHFSSYKNYFYQTWDAAMQAGQKFGTLGVANEAPQDFAARQVQVLQKIHSDLIGQNIPYRTHPIRGGGDDPGGTFEVTSEQLDTLKSNPYLTVEVRPQLPNGNYDVDYFYPKVEFYQKFKTRLSTALQQQLDTLSTNGTDFSKITQDQYNQLTQQMIQDLLTECFTRNGPNGDPIQIMKDMISIHSYDDMNGRSVRFYFMEHGLDRTLAPTFFPMGDFDVLVSPQGMTLMSQASRQALQVIMTDFLIEAQGARAQGRTANYFGPKLDTAILSGLDAMPIDTDLSSFGNSQLQLLWNYIQKRMWPEAFNLLCNPNPSDPSQVKNWRVFDAFAPLNYYWLFAETSG